MAAPSGHGNAGTWKSEIVGKKPLTEASLSWFQFIGLFAKLGRFFSQPMPPGCQVEQLTSDSPIRGKFCELVEFVSGIPEC
jgi:hypothetical protein